MARKLDLDYTRLCQAMARSRLTLRRFREERREAVRKYVGSHWSDEGSRENQPINLLSLYISIVGRSLIARNPRVLLTTFDRQNKPTVNAMQSWCNEEMERMNLATTLQRIVIDGLFSIGIAKIALSTPQDAGRFAWRLAAGAPFVERVDLDDFVYDIHARDFSEVGFIGHRYRVPLAMVKDDKNFSAARKDLSASDDPAFNADGDERISMLGRGYYGINSEEYEDFVDLWEVYLPRHRLVLTCADDIGSSGGFSGAGGIGEPLRVQPWVGSEDGPYKMLAYGVVPGNAMPKAPIQDLIDIHTFVNNTYNKLINQAGRQKEVTLVTGGAMEDGGRIQQSNDGDMIRNDNPTAAKVIEYGGPSAKNYQIFEASRNLFSYMAGNLELMGGLSPQSKTATQDKMLEANASQTVGAMQDTTVNFTGDILKRLCWYWHHDPFKVMKTTYQVPGMEELSVARKVTPQQRIRVKFEDLGIRFNPYSIQSKTPQQLLAFINQVVMNLQPMMPLLQQKGKDFDVDFYLQKIAEYGDCPDINQLFTVSPVPQMQQEGGTGQPEAPQTDAIPMKPQTERRYVRENMPGRTMQGEQNSRVAEMLGQNKGGAAKERNGTPAL